MPSSILAKYSPESFFDENTPTAIADKKLKIIWYNNAFKENFKSSRLKGTSVDSLLKTAGYESEIQLPLNKSSNVHLENKNKGIYISPLFTTGKSNEPF